MYNELNTIKTYSLISYTLKAGSPSSKLGVLVATNRKR